MGGRGMLGVARPIRAWAYGTATGVPCLTLAWACLLSGATASFCEPPGSTRRAAASSRVPRKTRDMLWVARTACCPCRVSDKRLSFKPLTHMTEHFLCRYRARQNQCKAAEVLTARSM